MHMNFIHNHVDTMKINTICKLSNWISIISKKQNFIFFFFHFSELSKNCRLSVDPLTCDSPHTKTFLLIQAHFSHLPLPNSDYLTDTKSVLDQSIRILQVNKIFTIILSLIKLEISFFWTWNLILKCFYF